MGRGYNTNTENSDLLYDDNAFQVFLLSLLLVYWVPSMLIRICRFVFRGLKKKSALDQAKEGWCDCGACQQKKEAKELSERSGLPVWDILFVLIGAGLVMVAIRVHRTSSAAEPPFDPFSILNVPTTATKREIQKAYRRLSIIHHPDKNLGDPTAGERFIRISKAFAALTDEDAKTNYIKYGNPDGYSGTTLGLGLPEWVARRQKAVLFMYVIFMVVMFPTFVGIWWRRRNKQMTDVVMTDTYMLYRDTLQNSHKFRDMLAAFASSFEFERLFHPEYSDKVQDLISALKRAGKMDLRKMNFVMQPTPVQVQNIVILSARIAGVPIPTELQPVLNKMLGHSEHLLTALADTVGMFQRPDAETAWNLMKPRGHTTHLTSCLRLMQCIFQGTDEKDVALLQLPHFTEKEVKFCTTSRTSPARDIYNFMRLSTEEQRSLLRGFTDNQFNDVMKFCERYPFASLTASTPAVEDEEDSSVYEGDTVTIRAKLTVMRKQGSVFSPHAPDLPENKPEIWWVWLADQRLLCPLDVRRLLPVDARGHNPDRRIQNDDDNHKVAQKDEDGNKLAKDLRVTIYDMKFTFLAPRAGTHTLELQAAVDCYHGCSKKVIVNMVVKSSDSKPPPPNDVKYFDTDDESELSSSDSDSDEEAEGSGTDGEYEYIEVTDDEASEEGSDDDIVDLTSSNTTNKGASS